ncbi:hypothetical protein CC79DRAFT_1275327 [Sarocladium strictum]
MSTNIAPKKRRPHRKSRYGCVNCKSRGVKCDERPGNCKRCETYGVQCAYGSDLASSMRLSTPASFIVTSRSQSTLRMPIGSGIHCYHLTTYDMAQLSKYQHRTAPALSTRQSRPVLVEQSMTMAFRHPFLMHAILAVTHSHDVAVHREHGSAEQVTHWHHAVRLLNSVLSTPLDPEARDATWLASILVSVVSLIMKTQQNEYQNVWPLTPPNALDLQWLKLCDGKRLIITLTDPLRDESRVRDMASEVMANIATMEHVVKIQPQDWSYLPCDLAQFVQMHVHEHHPHHIAASALCETYRSSGQFLSHLSFLTILDTNFRSSLELRDPEALLILLYWHVRTCELQIWFMWKHSWTEAMAIYEFLTRAWESSPELLTLLEYPRESLVKNKP